MSTIDSPRFNAFPTLLEVHESPADLYTRTEKHARVRYISGPLSGGPARDYYLQMDGGKTAIDLIIPHVIAANINLTQRLAGVLHEQIPDGSLTLPHDLGKRKEWGELEYNSFWSFYLSGVEGDAATSFMAASYTAKRREFINNYAIPVTERADHYREFRQEFLEYLRAKEVKVNPIEHIYQMPGAESSLGSQHEKELGEALGIPRSGIIFDSTHLHFAEKIVPNAPWLNPDTHTTKGTGKTLVVFK